MDPFQSSSKVSEQNLHSDQKQVFLSEAVR